MIFSIILIIIQTLLEIIFYKNFKEVIGIFDKLTERWNIVVAFCFAIILVIVLVIWSYFHFPKNIFMNFPFWLSFIRKLLDYYPKNKKK